MTEHNIAAICAYCVMRVRSERELKLAKCSRPARRKWVAHICTQITHIQLRLKCSRSSTHTIVTLSAWYSFTISNINCGLTQTIHGSRNNIFFPFQIRKKKHVAHFRSVQTISLKLVYTQCVGGGSGNVVFFCICNVTIGYVVVWRFCIAWNSYACLWATVIITI